MNDRVFITAYKLAVLEILRNLFVLAILRVLAIPTYRVYQLYDTKINIVAMQAKNTDDRSQTKNTHG